MTTIDQFRENEAKRLKLIELRKSIGLSIKDAANLFDTPYNTWWQWEGGDRRVPGIVIKALEVYKSTLPVEEEKKTEWGKVWAAPVEDDEDIPWL